MSQPDHTDGHSPRAWSPITDLPEDRSALRTAASEVVGLRRAWAERKAELEQSGALDEFTRRLVRSWCIETGVLEGIYSVSRGVTQTLVERGFDAAYVSHGDADVPAAHLIDVLKDHERVADGLFAFVKQERPLSTSYLKELHAALTAHQLECDGIDQFGIPRKIPLVRGDWKRLPNNPSDRGTGAVVHEYAPPEHTAAEMDRLVGMHRAHDDVEPEIEAAWLHHRFTQIHPFQDGNGRMARTLASLVLIRGRGFPFLVHREQKPEYIDALRAADAGDLVPLVAMVCRQQKAAILKAMEEGNSVLAGAQTIPAILEDAVRRLRQAAEGRHEAVLDVASRLQGRTAARFSILATQINEAVGSVPATTVNYGGWAGEGMRGDEHAHVVGTAERVNCRLDADRPFRAYWLEIAHGRRARLLVSSYFVAGSGSPVGVTLALVQFRPSAAQEWTRFEPACTEPFSFTGGQDPAEVEAGFDEWLERAITLGLEIWRRSL